MKFAAILLFAFLCAGCSAGRIAPAAAPRPTLSAIQVYMNETDNYYESIAAATDLIRKRMADQQKNPSLLDDKTWRDQVTGALSRIHQDYTIVTQAPPPPGSEEYHKAMINAEAHTDHAVALIGEWLSTKDQSRLDQAMQELAASDDGLAKAKTMLDTLLKGK